MSVQYNVTDSSGSFVSSDKGSMSLTTGSTGTLYITSDKELWIGSMTIGGANFDLKIYELLNDDPEVYGIIYTTSYTTAGGAFKYAPNIYSSYYKKLKVEIINTSGADSIYHYFVPASHGAGIPLRKV